MNRGTGVRRYRMADLVDELAKAWMDGRYARPDIEHELWVHGLTLGDLVTAIDLALLDAEEPELWDQMADTLIHLEVPS